MRALVLALMVSPAAMAWDPGGAASVDARKAELRAAWQGKEPALVLADKLQRAKQKERPAWVQRVAWYLEEGTRRLYFGVGISPKTLGDIGELLDGFGCRHCPRVPVGDIRGDTIGVPLPGVQVRIRAAADPGAGGPAAPGAGGPADPGADGEIQVRGPHVFAGYWNDPEGTQAAFTPDGWFRTGDIGAVDQATGHLMIRGRTKEMIITGGLNVYPREVEIALESHPSVAEAAVAGVPDQRWGERVTAWVVLRDGHGLDEAALIAHARTLLAGYKCPKRVFALAALPRNHLGKIVRSSLR